MSYALFVNKIQHQNTEVQSTKTAVDIQSEKTKYLEGENDTSDRE